MTSELVIQQSEYKQRLGKVRRVLKARRLKALYLVNPTRVLYTTGFSHISTERPLAVVIPAEGAIFAMGPALEFQHIRQDGPLIVQVYTYPDYPGLEHPMRFFARVLGEKGFGKSRIATDSFDGAAGGFGYRGPSLRELLREARFVDGRDFVDGMRLVKSDAEIRLLHESAKWSAIAHDILLENVGQGDRDVVAGVQASHDGLVKMLGRLGPRYRQLKVSLSPVIVGFRGQVGPESAIPHTVFTERKIRRGDVMVTEAGVEVGGYTSELERTVIVGKPSARTEKYFNAMLSAQNAALHAFRPGSSCASVDRASLEAVRQTGLEKDLLHHTGHGIGLDGHEPPWLDPGDNTLMRPGMVFSCEPGLYVPGYAGFRHSDTVAITEGGMSFITNYPRQLEDLTI